MRFLVSSGWVIQISRPGVRRSYYRFRPETWIELAKRQSSLYKTVAELTKKGMQLLEDAPAERLERLQTIHEMFDWFDREMPALWERWGREKGGTT